MNVKLSFSLSALASSILLLGCFATAEKTQMSDRIQQIAPETAIAENYLLIDSRSPDAFNGWSDAKAKASGHLPNAELFSARWVDWKLNLDVAIARLELQPEQKIAIYGETTAQRDTVAKALIASGKVKAEQISAIGGSFSQWGNNFKLNRLQGFQTLVPASYIKSRIGKAIIVQIGWDGGKGKDYRNGHIPGAIYWDDIEFEAPPIWSERPVEVIRKSLQKIGIDKDAEVIVYSTDPMGSTRGGAIMEFAGVKNVKVLNGTFETWQKLNMPVEKGWNQLQAKAEFGVTGEGDPAVIINVEQAKQFRRQPNSALVSVRAKSEFYGETSGYGYFKPAGRIPGALLAESGSKAGWDMSNYRNPDLTMRNPAEIKAFFADWTITPDKNLAFYCGNGWRAAEAWWYARAMGFEKATIYSSGWMRWHAEPDTIKGTGKISKQQAIKEQQALSSK